MITERTISNGLSVRARTIGGLRLIDDHEADDKIIAVMADDPIYGNIETLKDAPQSLIDRIRHYFLTYKDFPGQKRKIEMGEVYERDVACKVIEAAVADYKAKFHY